MYQLLYHRYVQTWWPEEISQLPSVTENWWEHKIIIAKPDYMTEWLNDLQWTRALTVPMHLGLVDRPFVPHNLILAQDSPVPLLKLTRLQSATNVANLLANRSACQSKIEIVFILSHYTRDGACDSARYLNNPQTNHVARTAEQFSVSAVSNVRCEG
jgi:hypothetical protein